MRDDHETYPDPFHSPCSPPARPAPRRHNYQRWRSLFEVLPVYSSDIVFLGNSITDGCEWAELFNNRHVKNRGISGRPGGVAGSNGSIRSSKGIPRSCS